MNPRERLTPRQLDCLRLRCAGLTCPQIADRLCIARQTVKGHLSAAYDALGIHAGNPEALACYMYGMADATRILPPSNAMRAQEV
jgi:DNA-binding NarL/FixJ family response regulator